MKIAKIKKTVYEVEPTVWKINMQVGTLIAKRKEQHIEYHIFEHCFSCDTKFDDGFIPNIAMVKSIGNRLFCDECAKRIKEDSSGHKKSVEEFSGMEDKHIGLIKSMDDYDIWFEPITDTINGFVIRNKDGSIKEIYMKDEKS